MKKFLRLVVGVGLIGADLWLLGSGLRGGLVFMTSLALILLGLWFVVSASESPEQ